MELLGRESLRTWSVPIYVKVGVRDTVFEQSFEEEVGVETTPVATDEGVPLTLSPLHLFMNTCTQPRPRYMRYSYPARGPTNTYTGNDTFYVAGCVLVVLLVRNRTGVGYQGVILVTEVAVRYREERVNPTNWSKFPND